jgi:hypothetical protein
MTTICTEHFASQFYHFLFYFPLCFSHSRSLLISLSYAMKRSSLLATGRRSHDGNKALKLPFIWKTAGILCRSICNSVSLMLYCHHFLSADRELRPLAPLAAQSGLVYIYIWDIMGSVDISDPWWWGPRRFLKRRFFFYCHLTLIVREHFTDKELLSAYVERDRDFLSPCSMMLP